jgi:hypothetical protein
MLRPFMRRAEQSRGRAGRRAPSVAPRGRKRLETKPELGEGADAVAEPKGCVGAERSIAIQDRGHPVARHAERPGERTRRSSPWFKKLLLEDRAGIDRAHPTGGGIGDISAAAPRAMLTNLLNVSVH